MSTTVNEAVRERLERVRGNSQKSMAERLMEIGKDYAAY
jgi:hypothetical protein